MSLYFPRFLDRTYVIESNPGGLLVSPMLVPVTPALGVNLGLGENG